MVKNKFLILTTIGVILLGSIFVYLGIKYLERENKDAAKKTSRIQDIIDKHITQRQRVINVPKMHKPSKIPRFREIPKIQLPKPPVIPKFPEIQKTGSNYEISGTYSILPSSPPANPSNFLIHTEKEK